MWELGGRASGLVVAASLPRFARCVQGRTTVGGPPAKERFGEVGNSWWRTVRPIAGLP